MRNLFFLFLCLNVNYLFAQLSELETKALFANAKSELKNGNTANALLKFESLNKENTKGNLTPFIKYFIGLCEIKENKLDKAQKTYEEMLLQYISWHKINEVRFNLGSIYLQKKETEKALQIFEKIEDKVLVTNVNEMLINSLQNKLDLKTLSIYQNKYPKMAVLNKLTEKQDTEKLFGLSQEKLPTLSSYRPKKGNTKNSWDVAVLFPFNKADANNQYAWDMYDGMKMAIARLKEQGVNINLHTYEVDNNPGSIKNLLKNKTFLEEDLLIGPLHTESNKIAQYYAYNAKVILVNPLTTQTNVIELKPHSFLNSTTLETQAIEIGKYGANNFTGDALIFYGDSKKDSIIAFHYVNWLKTKNINVLTNKKYKGAESFLGINKSKIGHIFFTSINGNSTFIDQVNKKLGIFPILSNAETMKSIGSINPETELYITDLDFFDENKEEIINFKNKYWESRSSIASIYTMKGYDMMVFWGKTISKGYVNFRTLLDIQSIESDFLLNGYDYSAGSNENKSVNVTKWIDGKFIKVTN